MTILLNIRRLWFSQAQQKLMISFNEYPNIMIKMLNACIKDAASCVGLRATAGRAHLTPNACPRPQFYRVTLQQTLGGLHIAARWHVSVGFYPEYGVQIH